MINSDCVAIRHGADSNNGNGARTLERIPKHHDEFALPDGIAFMVVFLGNRTEFGMCACQLYCVA